MNLFQRCVVIFYQITLLNPITLLFNDHIFIASTVYSAFFQIFSSIYGCGPATARKWYEKGYRNITDITKAVKDGMKLTEQQTMGETVHG